MGSGLKSRMLLLYQADGFWMGMSWGPTGRTLVLQQLADVIKA
ncbi:hypothetical protein [Paenibacillus silvisoli]|nr:hypothetical protein [Paenibacillus silvisoli]